MTPLTNIKRILLSLIIFATFISHARADRPNILLINLDDADRDMFRADVLRSKFPVMANVARNGMTFRQFYVCSPKCGPSRACLLRGQYAHAINHRTNVHAGPMNRGFTGGFKNFLDQGFYADDFGKWMRTGGYETVFVGKYLNGFTEFNVPPGWDHFYLSRGSEYFRTHRFTNRDPNNPKTERTKPGVYRTDAEVNDLVEIINTKLTGRKPFLIYYAPFGPHQEGKATGRMVANELVNNWPNIKQVRQADFNEKNISDKPITYRQFPLLTFEDKLAFQVENRERMLSVKSIDNGLAKIIAALQAKGQYNNTYIFITSDNGHSMGQHRVSGKGNSMSRSSNVPLIVSGPGIPRNSFRTALSSQIDLAPTFLDLAGLSTKPFFSGKSLRPVLFSRDDLGSADFRESLLVENWEFSRLFPVVMKTTFCQLRTPTGSYTEWADGSREYYDISIDPFELRNLSSRLSSEDIDRFRTLMNGQREPMSEPICTMESPKTHFAESTGPPYLLQGVAEDSQRIKKVELVIRKVGSNEYWNGSQWLQSRTVILADLGNPDGIQSEWQFSFEPPEPDFPRESYWVSARAFSTTGNFNRKIISRRFKYDSLKPVTILKNPRVRNNRHVVLWGTSRDDRELRHTKVVVQRNRDNRFLKGTGFVSARSSFKIRSNEKGDWEFTTPRLLPGTYTVRARAFDAAGNFDSTPQVKQFVVK